MEDREAISCCSPHLDLHGEAAIAGPVNCLLHSEMCCARSLLLAALSWQQHQCIQWPFCQDLHCRSGGHS